MMRCVFHNKIKANAVKYEHVCFIFREPDALLGNVKVVIYQDRRQSCQHNDDHMHRGKQNNETGGRQGGWARLSSLLPSHCKHTA